MKEINCIGDFCPIPILKIKKMLESCEPGETFVAISDHDCVRESIEEFLSRMRFSYSIKELNDGIFQVLITKNC